MGTKRSLKTIVLLLVCALSLQMSAFTTDDESISPLTNAYIARTWATVERGSNGLLNIAFDISGMGKMDEIGATAAYLFEVTENSSGIVAVYNYHNPAYAYMMGSNSSFHAGNLPYQGTPGHKYYAEVYFRAGNSTGSGSTVYTTAITTALN